jgi:hypothetical protein
MKMIEEDLELARYFETLLIKPVHDKTKLSLYSGLEMFDS